MFWATIQDGPLFYFNSWFVFGLLLALGLGAAAAAVQLAAAWFPRAARTPWPALALVALAAGLFTAQAGRFRATTGDDEASRNLNRSVGLALAEDGAAGQGRLKYLAFASPNAWEDAAGVALELARRGESFRVGAGWGIVFGADTAPANPREGLAKTDDLRIWRILPPALDPEAATRRPLFHGNGLRLEPFPVDPAVGTAITFGGPQPNAAAYLLTGWSDPAPGDAFTMSEQPLGSLAFRAVPVPETGAEEVVEIAVDAFPILTPGRVESQRLALHLNGQPLGEWTVRRDDGEPIRVRIPAARWNTAAAGAGAALLEFRFPDAASPVRLGVGGDPRELAFGFRAVRFALVNR